MNNQQLIKQAHVWLLAVAVACGLVFIVAQAGVRIDDQNSNQNSNSSQNANKMTSQDRNFIMDAAMGGMEEVELGRVAAEA